MFHRHHCQCCGEGLPRMLANHKPGEGVLILHVQMGRGGSDSGFSIIIGQSEGASKL